MARIKKLFPYIFLFIIFMIWNIFILPLDTDGVWSYGFAHNIYNGLIPYKDFNMVITPLYPFLISLIFHLTGSNFLIFSIINVIILLVIYYLLYKILGNKAWLIILIMFFFPHFLGTYNWLLFLLFLLIILLEKENKDFYIGLVLSLIILTKQSVGICMLLPSLLYIKDKTKILSRLKGFIIPIIIFIIYLITTNSLYNFYDLCIAGLFDFAGSNKNFLNINLLFIVLMIIITIYFIIKNNKDINNYYLLTFYSITIPIFDLYHFKYSLFAFLVILLLNIKSVPEKLPYKVITIIVILCITLISFKSINLQHISYPNNIKHFEYKYLSNNVIKLTNDINKFINEKGTQKIVFLNSNAYYFKLVNNIPIKKIDLINMGNWGYNGSSKLLQEIKKYRNTYFIINKQELNKKYQTDKKALNYIIENGQEIQKIGIYDVYFVN